jgi:tRNA threonylcarbamoyladenosine biosynthesis protein TsaB
MKLYIDTTNSEMISISLDGEKFTAESKNKKAQMLLPFILEILQIKKRSLKDINRIELNTGPGSFTGLRVGVSVANALGWSLGIPVNGKRVRKSEFVQINYS